MKQLTSTEELDTILSTGKTILLFTADWCPDCRFIEPFMPEIEEEYKDFTFVSVDRDEFLSVCSEHDVFGIPSFVAFEDGKEVGRFVSKFRKTKEEIEIFIDELPVKAS